MTPQGNVKKLGYLWYDQTQMANIFGFSHLADKHCITYDNWEEDKFMLHSGDGILKLNHTNKGLYDYCPCYSYINIVAAEKSMQTPQ